MIRLCRNLITSLIPILPAACLVGGCIGSSGTPGPGDCSPLEQADVADDTTLPAGCYLVSSPLQISQRLDIEGGVTLYFTATAGLTVASDGVLAAVGTPDQPVLMTPSSEGWLGVRLMGSASSENRLENTTVEGATGVGVQVDSGARLNVIASAIRGAGEIGLMAESGTEVSVVATTFAANALPLSVGIDVVGGIGADNVFEGNDQQIVRIESGTLADPTQWAAPGVPYRLTGDARIGAALTLDPGVVIEMPQDARFYVLETGSLTAAGTSGASVEFRGVQDERGYWRGISFASKDSSNVLRDCVVANGGSGRWNGNAESIGMVWLEPGSKVQISNCILRASAGPAVATFGDADLTGFSRNAVEDNRSTLVLAPGMVHQIDASTTFSANDEAFIRVGDLGAITRNAIKEPATWQRQPIPYRIIEDVIVESAWEIEAGAEIEVAQDTGIYVADTGSITAVGTPESPIVIRGKETLQGYWRGIEILSRSTSNTFDYVELSHAGSRGFTGNAESDGLLYLEGGSLSISNTSLSASGGYGVSIFANGALIGCSNVTFSGNAKGDVYIHSSGGTSDCP